MKIKRYKYTFSYAGLRELHHIIKRTKTRESFSVLLGLFRKKRLYNSFIYYRRKKEEKDRHFVVLIFVNSRLNREKE